MTNSEMYRNQTNKFWSVLFLLLIITLSPVLAEVNIYDILDKESQNVFDIGKISNGKPIVKDLFNKNLELIKNNEIKATNATIKKMITFYAEKDCYIKKSDILNLILNNNYSSLYTIESVAIEKTNQKTGMPSANEIDKSYDKFLKCKKHNGEDSNYKDLQEIENEVNNLFTKIINNEYNIETKSQDNFGEDLFRNGDEEDSSFDILKDIYNIGHILLEDFKEQIKIYFYGENKSGSKTDLSLNTIIGKKFASIENQSEYNPEGDGDIDNFIIKTNQTSQENPDEDNIYQFDNQCVEDNKEDQTPITNPNKIDYDKMINEIQNFISNSNAEEKANESLTENFNKETEIPKTNNTTGDKGKENQKIENFIDKNLTINNGCYENCENKNSIQAQEQCEMNCASDCFRKCEEKKTSLQKKTCKIECTCFIISGPKKPLLNNFIDSDIYKIRFCKVPVVGPKIQRNKTVGSLDEFFFEINVVFQNLRDSGQMIKHTQTREFLEIPIKINLGKLFSFVVNTNQKKIQNTKASKTIENEKKNQNKAQEAAINDIKSLNNEKDNYNKYIIVQSTIGENTNVENNINTTIRQQNIENEKQILESSKTRFENIIKDIQNEKTISLSIQLENFLADNLSFRQEFGTITSDANNIAYSLNEKIKASD